MVNGAYPDAVAGVPKPQRIGLLRNVIRLSAAANYEFDNGMTFTMQGGYNDLEATWIRDQGLSAIAQNLGRDPQTQEDLSIEACIVSNQEGRLRWLAGVNYYEQDFTQSGTGGRVVVYCWDTLPNVPENGPGCAPIPPLRTTNAFQNTDHVETSALFGSIAYDMSDQFTINLEGRYQEDRLDKAGQDIDANTFLPRVILQYQPGDDTNLYASFSQGVLPGEGNPFVIAADTQELAQYTAQFGDRVAAILLEEKLDSYEIGWKQTLFDGRANFAATAYYGEWANQKSRVVAIIQETCNGLNATSAGCRPADLTPLGGFASLADGTPISTPRNTSISGTGDIWGVEFEGSAVFAEGWVTDFNIAWADNKFTDFEANFIASYSNFTNVNGNEHSRYPKWSRSITSTYTQPLNDNWDWFVRGDAVYFGKTWVSVANLAQCNDYWLFNARAGVERDDVRLELWVKNAFDDDNWSACARWTDFTRPIDFRFFTFFQGVAVTPQNKRQFGLKTSIKL